MVYSGCSFLGFKIVCSFLVSCIYKNAKYFSIRLWIDNFFTYLFQFIWALRVLHSFNFQWIGFVSDFHRFCTSGLTYISCSMSVTFIL